MGTRPVTVMQQCMNEIISRLRAMPLDPDDPEGGGTFWNNVEFGSIVDRDIGSLPIIGVYEGAEEVVFNLYPLVQKNVTLYFEFRFTSAVEVDVYDEYRYYIGRLQQVFLGDLDRTLGGLCNNVYENGNNPEIEGRQDPAPGGVLMLTLQYEHMTGDPYKSRKDFENGH